MGINNLPAVIPQPNLAALVAVIRGAHQGVTLAATNLIEHALAAGDALITAKTAVKATRGPGHWLKWLRDECDLSEDRAERYMRIARGRALLEANSARVRNLSLAGALRLLPKLPRAKPSCPAGKTQQAGSLAAIARQIKLDDELPKIRNTNLDTATEKDALIELKQLDAPRAADLVNRAAQGEAVSATAAIDNRKFKSRPDAAKLMEDFSRHSRVLLRDWTRATPAERRQWLKDLEEYADLDILPFSRREAAA